MNIESLKLKSLLMLGNAIILLVLVLISGVTFQSVTSMVKSSQSLNHTYLTIRKGINLLEEMVNMETGMRGFTITGNEAYLDPYHQGQLRFDQLISDTKVMVNDSLVQQQRLELLLELKNQWQTKVAAQQIELKRQIVERQSIVTQFEQLRARTLGKQIFDQMRKQLALLDALADKQKNYRVSMLIQDILLDLLNQETGQRGFLLSGNEISLEPYHIGQRAFNEHIAELRSMVNTDGSMGLAPSDINPVVTLYVKWQTEVATPEIEARKAINKIPATHTNLTALIEAGTGKQLMDRIRELMAEFKAEQHKVLETRELESHSIASDAKSLLILGTLIAIALGVVATFFVVNRIVSQVGGEPKEIMAIAARVALGDLQLDRQDVEGNASGIYGSLLNIIDSLNITAKQANAVAQGNYDGEITPRSDKDQLTIAMATMTRTLREISAENARQNWLKSGQARLNEVMRGEQVTAELSVKILNFLALYFKAPVAVFYLAEGDQFRLVGSYAFKHRKSNDNVILAGEGLIGQAVTEKQTILFNDVPQDHIQIQVRSGTGESLPRSLLVVPLVYQGKVKGVLEIGNTRHFSKNELELMERSAEDIAITLHAAESREKLEKLLQESQVQSEEMQTQQEELRVSNEELEEQAQALEQNQVELEAQKEELSVSNERLQEQQLEVGRQNSQLEKTQLELEEKAQAIAESSRYKTEFLANMSHELRTPLNSLLILSELLANNKEANLTPKQIEFAKTINNSGAELLSLINDVLDLSKIEAGKMDLSVESIRTVDLAEYAQSQFLHQAEKKGIKLNVNVTDDAPQTIVSDRQKLLQVLKNLLSNAIKFTQKGQVDFTISAAPDKQQINKQQQQVEPSLDVLLTIVDSGIGIAKDKQNVIFDAFSQGDGSTSRIHGGTGLGLSISKELVKMLKGSIGLTSELAKGSTFSVYLPREISDVDASPQLPSVSPQKPGSSVLTAEPSNADKVKLLQSGAAETFVNDDRKMLAKNEKCILIIEDDLKFSQILCDLARERGFKVLAASDGEKGLLLAEMYLPSAIILDIGLPSIDGWTVMEELKRSPKMRHIPVNFISAHDKNLKALQMGAIGYITKPVSESELDDAFDKIERMLTKKIKHLLIIEDDHLLLPDMLNMFDKKSVTTKLASSGKEALSMIKTESFDCIVLDVALKDMSSFKFLEEVSQNPDLQLPPIVVYTGQEISVEQEQKLRHYTDSIIMKGAKSLERLFGELTLFMHQVETNLSSDKQKVLRKMYNQQEILTGKIVLIVDDDVRNSFALSNMLEDKGIEYVQAFNGVQALELLATSPQVDLVLMDIMMPEMDGYECMQKIRQQQQWKKLPIIALTAKAMEKDRQKCIDAGANDYLTKPIDTSRLLSLMRIFLC